MEGSTDCALAGVPKPIDLIRAVTIVSLVIVRLRNVLGKLVPAFAEG